MKTIATILFALALAFNASAQFGPDASSFWTTNSTPGAGGFYLFTLPGVGSYNVPASVLLTASQTTQLVNQAQINTTNNLGTAAYSAASAFQAADADLTDLADGSLTGSKVGSGISGDNLTTGTVVDARIAATIARLSDLVAATNITTLSNILRASFADINNTTFETLGVENFYPTNTFTGHTNAILATGPDGRITNAVTSGGGAVARTNAPTIASLTTTGSQAVFSTAFTSTGEPSFTGNGTLYIAGRRLRFPDYAMQLYSPFPAEFRAGIMTTNSVALNQNPVWPTNNFTGSATATNWVFVPWRGWVIIAATNYQVGGWMWQTNGPNGYPVAGAFNPATMP